MQTFPNEALTETRLSSLAGVLQAYTISQHSTVTKLVVFSQADAVLISFQRTCSYYFALILSYKEKKFLID